MRRPLPTLATDPPAGSLAAALLAVPDPRRPFGWRGAYPPIPLVALLQVAIAAMLCGSTSMVAPYSHGSVGSCRWRSRRCCAGPPV